MSVGAPDTRIEAALAETLPLLPDERRWSFRDMLAVKSGLAIATWAFLFGGTTGQLVGFVDGVIAIVCGTVIGIGLLFFALLLPAYKWGTESFVFMRSAFGPRGTSVLAFLFVVGSVPFWIAILASMAGASAHELLVSLGFDALTGNWPVATVVTFAVLVLGGLFAALGSNSLRLLNLALVPLLVLLSVSLLVALLVQPGWTAILAAQPAAPPHDRAINLMLAVELNVVGGFSWFGLVANIARFGKTARSAVWGSWVGLVPVYALPVCVGLASSLALGSEDPVRWMTPLLGPGLGLVMLVVLILANLSSVVGMLQGNMPSVIQNLGRPVQLLGFARTVVLFVIVAAAIVLLATDALYSRFYSVVAFFGAIYAGCVGVLLADRLVLRRNQLSIRGLHDLGAGGPYHFWRGVNPAAFAAVAVAFAAYLVLLEPLEQAPGPGFWLLGASLPAVAAAFVVHVGLSRLWVIRAGLGEYPVLRGGVADIIVNGPAE